MDVVALSNDGGVGERRVGSGGILGRVTSVFSWDPTAWLHGLVDVARVPLAMVVAMWILAAVSAASGGALAHRFAIVSWRWSRLWTVATAPWVHAGWGHLSANTVPLLVFGIYLSYLPRPRLSGVLAAVPVAESLSLISLLTIVAAVCSGIAAWALARPGTRTVGASGVVFGYAAFLIDRLLVSGSFASGLVAMVGCGLAIWALSFLRGLIPAWRSPVSWQAHVGGFVGGLVASHLLLAPA